MGQWSLQFGTVFGAVECAGLPRRNGSAGLNGHLTCRYPDDIKAAAKEAAAKRQERRALPETALMAPFSYGL